MASEKSLRDEIAYLTNLINQHKNKTTEGHHVTQKTPVYKATYCNVRSKSENIINRHHTKCSLKKQHSLQHDSSRFSKAHKWTPPYPKTQKPKISAANSPSKDIYKWSSGSPSACQRTWSSPNPVNQHYKNGKHINQASKQGNSQCKTNSEKVLSANVRVSKELREAKSTSQLLKTKPAVNVKVISSGSNVTSDPNSKASTIRKAASSHLVETSESKKCIPCPPEGSKTRISKGCVVSNSSTTHSIRSGVLFSSSPCVQSSASPIPLMSSTPVLGHLPHSERESSSQAYKCSPEDAKRRLGCKSKYKIVKTTMGISPIPTIVPSSSYKHKSQYKLVKSPEKNSASSLNTKLPSKSSSPFKLIKKDSLKDFKPNLSRRKLPVKSRFKIVKTPTAKKPSQHRFHTGKGLQIKEKFYQNRQSLDVSPVVAAATYTFKQKSRYKLVKKAVKISCQVSADRSRPQRISRSDVRQGSKGKCTFVSKYALKRRSAVKTSESKTSINSLLGRQIRNYSRNRFKFRSTQMSVCPRRRSKPIIPDRTKLKIDRRSKSRFSWSSQSTPKRMLQKAAQQVLQKSIHTAANRRRFSKINPKAKQYCLYYSRFGRCHRGASCKHIHDPKRIAICTRFLQGRCHKEKCPFSHQAVKEKVPVCQFFLKGICSRDNCPYLHVNVDKDAVVCPDFLEHGYCPLADKCGKKHEVPVCQEYKSSGKCKNGKKCKLQHARPKEGKKRKTSRQDLDARMEENKKVSGGEVDEDEIWLPLKDRKLPSFIALSEESGSETVVKKETKHSNQSGFENHRISLHNRPGAE